MRSRDVLHSFVPCPVSTLPKESDVALLTRERGGIWTVRTLSTMSFPDDPVNITQPLDSNPHISNTSSSLPPLDPVDGDPSAYDGPYASRWSQAQLIGRPGTRPMLTDKGWYCRWCSFRCCLSR